MKPRTIIGIVFIVASFIGGVGNHASRIVDKDAQTLHIIADNFFGGVDIKN